MEDIRDSTSIISGKRRWHRPAPCGVSVADCSIFEYKRAIGSLYNLIKGENISSCQKANLVKVFGELPTTEMSNKLYDWLCMEYRFMEFF